jgi:hypothetical protein
MNPMRTIGSRKTSDTSNGDASAPQRTTVPEPLRSLVCGSLVGFAISAASICIKTRRSTSKLLKRKSGSPETRFSNFLCQDFLIFVGFELD